MSDQHVEDIERLWRALRRDLGNAVLEMAGFLDSTTAINRFEKNWAKLCDLDLDVAAKLYHGIEEVSMTAARLGKSNSPAQHALRQMDEVPGMAEIARAKNPDVVVSTLGELIKLGEVSIRREIDADTGE